MMERFMGEKKTYEFSDHGNVTVEDSCGCVFCDIGLEPLYSGNTWWHELKNGHIVHCDNPKRQ